MSAAGGSDSWHYYVWLGAVRFELKRPLTRLERFRCWFSPWNYQETYEPKWPRQSQSDAGAWS